MNVSMINRLFDFPLRDSIQRPGLETLWKDVKIQQKVKGLVSYKKYKTLMIYNASRTILKGAKPSCGAVGVVQRCLASTLSAAV